MNLLEAFDWVSMASSLITSSRGYDAIAPDNDRSGGVQSPSKSSDSFKMLICKINHRNTKISSIWSFKLIYKNFDDGWTWTWFSQNVFCDTVVLVALTYNHSRFVLTWIWIMPSSKVARLTFWTVSFSCHIVWFSNPGAQLNPCELLRSPGVSRVPEFEI